MKKYIIIVLGVLFVSCVKTIKPNYNSIEGDTDINMNYYLIVQKRTDEVDFSIKSIEGFSSVKIVSENELTIRFKLVFQKPVLGIAEIRNGESLLVLVFDHRDLQGKKVNGEVELSLSGKRSTKKNYLYCYINKSTKNNKEKRKVKTKFYSRKQYLKLR